MSIVPSVHAVRCISSAANQVVENSSSPAPVEYMMSMAKILCPAEDDILELTTRGAPRWFARGATRHFIPMSNWQVRRSGSRMYPAFRWTARAYRAILRSWITIGGARFTHRIVPKRGDEWPLGDLLLPDMPTLSTAAVSIGIPGPAQKITVQLMDQRGRILGFAKYADNPYTRGLLANEARMLELLPENVGPRLVRLTPFLGGVLLVQTALPGRPRAPRMRLDTAQVRFFQRLVQPHRVYAAYQHPFIEDLRARSGERRSSLEAIVEIFEDSEWSVVWMHGDLAPWNMRWWRGTCLAFDWEHGREAGFAYVDAAATLIQVASKIQRLGPQQAKEAVSARLKALLPAGHGEFAPAIAALSALNMLVSWYPPRKPDAYEDWLTMFVHAGR